MFPRFYISPLNITMKHQYTIHIFPIPNYNYCQKYHFETFSAFRSLINQSHEKKAKTFHYINHSTKFSSNTAYKIIITRFSQYLKGKRNSFLPLQRKIFLFRVLPSEMKNPTLEFLRTFHSNKTFHFPLQLHNINCCKTNKNNKINITKNLLRVTTIIISIKYIIQFFSATKTSNLFLL